MRTPLSVMKLNAQMIQRSAVKFYTASPSEMAFNIERHIDSITNILDQYLSGVGDACDNVRINATVFDLSCLINQVLNDMRGLYPGYKFINNAKSKILIKADRFLILRVLINYLNNAVQYSPIGSLITTNVKKKNDFVEVSVADEGSGIHQLDLPYIFDRFYKAGPENSIPGASKGLGLFMVKQIIAKHHGEVFVKSGAKGGSIFYFTLPGYVE
jgi:two-component system sensor histidine kinase VicK